MAAKTGFKQQCPHCDAKVPIKDEKLIGEEIKCPKCKNPFVVEDPADAVVPTTKSKKSKKGKADGGGDQATEKAEKALGGGGSTKLIVGLGLAAVVVLLLAVAAYFMFGPDTKPSSPGAGQVAAPAPQPQPEAPPSDKGGKASGTGDEESATASGNPTNLLPNDTEVVLNLSVRDLKGNPLGRVLLGMGDGSAASFQERYGFPIDDVDRWIAAGHYSQEEWLFQVVRTKKNVKPDAVIAALRLKKADNSIGDQTYYLSSDNWLEAGSPLRADDKPDASADSGENKRRPLAVRFVDSTTIVLADLTPMQDFLRAKGHPKAKPVSGAKKGRTAAPAPAEPAEGEGGASGSYQTLSPTLKHMLTRLEAHPPVLFSYAIDFENATSTNLGAGGFRITEALSGLGMALQMKERFHFELLVDGKSEADALALRTNLSLLVNRLAALAPAWGLNLLFTENLPAQPKAGGRPQGGGEGDDEEEGGGKPPPPPRGGGMRGARGGGGRGAPPPATPKATASADSGKPAEAKASLFIKAKAIQLTIDCELNSANSKVMDKLMAAARPYVIRTEGEFEMVTGHPSIHALASGAFQYGEAHRQFPQGALRRTPSSARANRPWPPDRRISWMADLLPYLGYQRLYQSIHPRRSWQDPENVDPSVTLLPVFLSAGSPRNSWYVNYPGLKYQVAATHYVGMAGIGLDAAEYSAADPALANKLGVFGYDRVTRLPDIRDGVSNTILIIQTPAYYKSPWIAGGGSTVRGVPETNSIQPFVSMKKDGKGGTLVIMCDGTVRFLSAGTSDEVFKAMCTIHGGEPKINLDKIAPKVPPPGQQEAENVSALFESSPTSERFDR